MRKVGKCFVERTETSLLFLKQQRGVYLIITILSPLLKANSYNCPLVFCAPGSFCDEFAIKDKVCYSCLLCLDCFQAKPLRSPQVGRGEAKQEQGMTEA